VRNGTRTTGAKHDARILRIQHHPSGRFFIVDPQRARVLAVAADKTTISLDDEQKGEHEGIRSSDLIAAAQSFETLWKWPAPGTRFPQRGQTDADFPDGWFAALQGRLNRTGLQGDLEFRGYIDALELARLARGEALPTERSALERHLTALDFRLRGKLGLVDLYRAFIATRRKPVQAIKKALAAYVMFGRGRAVDITQIGARRPAARSGGFDAHGEVDLAILDQYRRLFQTTCNDEIEQDRLAQFNRRNFQNGIVSKQQWKSFFASCSDLNGRDTVTFAQLVGMFKGSFEYVAASRADARGQRPLDRVLPG
jgi:hypothetical protein